WSTIFDWDPAQAARSRRKFLTEIAGTGKYVLPIHFPHPTTGLIETAAHGSGTSLCDKQYLLGSLGHMSDRSLVRRVAMLYCIRMDVWVPHALAPEQLERLEAEEKGERRNCNATAGGGTCGVLRGNTQHLRRRGP